MLTKRRLLIVSVLLLTTLWIGCSPQPVIVVEKAPNHQALFDNRSGWIGADGANSVPLSASKTLWLFGDTLVGEVRGGRRIKSKLINNSIAIQHGRGDFKSKIDFFYNKKDGSPAAFVLPLDGRGWLWPYHGITTKSGLFIFFIQIDYTEIDSPFGFRPIGGWLGHISNPHDPVNTWKIKQEKIPWIQTSLKRNLIFGSALLKSGGYIYIYGTDEDIINGSHFRHMILARILEDSFPGLENWEFHSNGSWARDLSKATRLCKDMPNEYSVTYIAEWRKYALVYSQTNLSEKIALRLANTPYGPWEDPINLYRCPENDPDKNVFCYAAKAHSDLFPHNSQFILTYIANAADMNLLNDNSNLYTPQFLKITFETR
jgi:hypothetical protein